MIAAIIPDDKVAKKLCGYPKAKPKAWESPRDSIQSILTSQTGKGKAPSAGGTIPCVNHVSKILS
jgi:hypothetical protein